MFGIIYLRARRIDYMEQLASPPESPNIPTDRIPYNLRVNESNQSPFLAEREDFAEDSRMTQEEQFLLWRIYDKIINAFTSEFVVLNLCRLGL